MSRPGMLSRKSHHPSISGGSPSRSQRPDSKMPASPTRTGLRGSAGSLRTASMAASICSRPLNRR